jgi:hypothetical protein
MRTQWVHGRELSRFLHRSPEARASYGIFRALAVSHCGSITWPAICWLLRSRYPESTTAHALVSLARLGAIQQVGARIRTRAGGWARLWRAV